jgi:hypothetical protein
MGAMMLAAMFGTTAGAAPAFPNRDVTAPAAALVLVDARCGQGWHYVPGRYHRRGKWRAGYCSRG